MAYNPLDFLKNLVPDNINMFGAGPNQMTQSLLDNEFITQKTLEKAKKQSLFQGLLNTGLAYAAQPKNQGYGSIFPYLAKAGLAGVQAAQSPFDRLTENSLNVLKLNDMKTARDQKIKNEQFAKLYGAPNTGKMKIDGSQIINTAPFQQRTLQDNTIGSTLMGANELSTNRQPTAVAPDFETSKASIRQLMDNNLLGADGGLNFLTNNNNLQRQYTGIFDQEKYIDEGVRLGVIDPIKAMEMKASAAQTKDVKFRNPTDDIVINGKVVERGELKKDFQILDEAALQDYEKNNKLAFNSVPRTDNTGNNVVYQIGPDNKIQPLKLGSGVNVKQTISNVGNQADEGGTNVTLKYLEETHKFATDAYKGLPKIRQAYNLINTAQTGAFSDEIVAINKIRKKMSGDPTLKAQLASVTDTEELKALLGREVFGLIGKLGIGARGLDTPAERDFLISVFTGLPKLEQETLRRLTARRLKAAEEEISAFNTAVDKDYYRGFEENFRVATRASGPTNFYSKLDVSKIYDGLEGFTKSGEKAIYLDKGDGKGFNWYKRKGQTQ
tara:strand:+ start:1144 stop:2805 length:1662 start_codon:yes stop_codon:yes gene_type:complete